MDPVLLLSALLLLAFGLIGVGTAEPGLLQDHLLRVGPPSWPWSSATSFRPASSSATPSTPWWASSSSSSWSSSWGTGPGVRRWFYLGPVALQPSELAKLALILYLSSFVGRRGEDYPILGPVLAVGSLVGLVLVEPDFATAAFLAGLAVLLFVLAGIPWPRLLGMGLAVALVVLPFSGLYLAQFRYVSERFANFVDYLQGESEPGAGPTRWSRPRRPSSWAAPSARAQGPPCPTCPRPTTTWSSPASSSPPGGSAGPWSSSFTP